MSSQSKIDANRRNALRSTGPSTPTGKAASSRNAVSHGLTATVLTLMPNEKQSDLDALIRTLTNEHQPEGDTERFLVDQMIQARWRLARLARFEAEAFDRLLDDNPDGNLDRSAIVEMERPGNVFDKLERYRAAAERSFSKAVRDLAQLRANRHKIAKLNKAKEAEAWLRHRLLEVQSPPADLIHYRWPPVGEQNEAITSPEDMAARL